MDRKKLDQWIRRQVYDDEGDAGRCLRLTLKHLGLSRREGQEIGFYKVPSAKKTDENWIVETVNRIEGDSMSDAGGIGGVQRYVVLAFYEKTGEKPMARFTFREAGHDEEYDEDESEPATRAGHMAQMMRHNEAIMRIAVAGTGQVLSYLQRSNSNQAEIIEKLITEKMRGIETMEDLKSQEFERRLIREKEERDDKRKAEVFEKLMALAPVVVNKIAGKNLLPAPSTEREMMRALLGSLSEDQLLSLSRILRPEQSALIAEIAGSVQDSPHPGNGKDTSGTKE